MKRTLLILALVSTLAVGTSYARGGAETGSLGLGLNGGVMIPTSGDVRNDSTFNDFFDVGPGFGAHISYVPLRQLTLEAGFDYAFMKLKDDARIGSDEPYFSAPYLYVTGKWNMGSFIKSESNIFNPYLLAGGGVYFWKVTDDGVDGDAVVLGNGEELKKTSLGLQFGAGTEIFAMSNLSLFAEGKYHLIFSEDEDTFGDQFENLGAMSVSAGLTYYFPIGAK